MKKVIIVGVGAQGSTIAKRLNEDPAVSEIICADYDLKAAQELGNTLEKATALQLDAGKVENVVQAAQGCHIIVNGRRHEPVEQACVDLAMRYGSERLYGFPATVSVLPVSRGYGKYRTFGHVHTGVFH